MKQQIKLKNGITSATLTEQKEARLRAEVQSLENAAWSIWEERLRSAISWLAAHHPDKTFGREPKILRSPDHDYGLADLETYSGGGQRGNAVLLSSEFGELWWCEPNEPANHQWFLLRGKPNDIEILKWTHDVYVLYYGA